MLTNFLRSGRSSTDIDIICRTDSKKIPDAWLRLQEKFFAVNFHFYEKGKEKFSYPPSLRPHVLKQHFAKHPELKNETILYHDCDILLSKPLDFTPFLEGDTWYLSDTSSYIGHKYIKTKEHGIYEKMCDIVGIDPEIPAREESNSGGAQYIIKNVDHTFWEEVEQHCESLYQFFLKDLEEHPKTDTYNPIQKWTADMWAVLWTGWKHGHPIKTDPRLGFSWAVSKLAEWDKHSIFHNAGVVGAEAKDKKLFFKGAYTKTLPYDIRPEDYDQEKCTIRYVEAVLQAGAETCLR